MGVHAFALSRFSGLWAGMKTIQEVVESSTRVDIAHDRVKIVLPEDFILPVGGLHLRWPDSPLEQEARMMEYKWYAALAYIRANQLNHTTIQGLSDRIGIIASGKAYRDTRQALLDLGLDEATCQRVGIRLHQVNVVWPLEPTITRAFALGLKEILVVEEKRQLIEYQIKEELYNWRADVRPDVLGKFDQIPGDHTGGEWSHSNPAGHWLLRANADLTPSLIAQAIAHRLEQHALPEDVRARIQARLSIIQAKNQSLLHVDTSTGERPPWFCSGCPHNTSTRVPEGSRALAGIGCHYMAIWMDRDTVTFTQMGGEGAPWVGQAPFINEDHVFANIGDGTWFHSGSLAIRQAVAAGVNITYKILYNDAVAMTGGQQVGERPEGLSVPQIVKSCVAEGTKRIVVVTEDTERYDHVKLEAGVEVVHRDELDRIQRELRELKGTTIIVYDQTCATEKRRRRKSGKLEDPKRVVVINELVCEGCGDCSSKSNCLSVEPLETEFGRKRQINHSSCNKDESCLNGFCPSFVVLENAVPRKRTPESIATTNEESFFKDLPLPMLPRCDEPYRIVVAGVGGTGVITIGQLLGMAAHIEGKGIITQDSAGLAQKGGATWSHVQIAEDPTSISATKVDIAQANLILACDGIVAASSATLTFMRTAHTNVALNTHATPTAGFVQSPDWQSPHHACTTAITQTVGAEHLASLDTSALALSKLGDSIYANPILLGFAWQKGWIPLTLASLHQALVLNNVQVERNLQAFAWGRAAALGRVNNLIASQETVINFKPRTSLEDIIKTRHTFLTAYQHAAYAKSYVDFVAQVQQTEESLSLGSRLSTAVARYLFKLMAYKDEYEVARLHTQTDFADELRARYEPGFQIAHHLAPPLLSKKNTKGELIKRRFGPWVRPILHGLAKLKFLRETPFDPFGFSDERQQERTAIGAYKQTILELLTSLNQSNIDLAVQIASIPENIRGYGHVKARHVASAQEKQTELLARWRG